MTNDRGQRASASRVTLLVRGARMAVGADRNPNVLAPDSKEALKTRIFATYTKRKDTSLQQRRAEHQAVCKRP